MSPGLIYVLTNPAMDGIVKIGRTCQPINRRIDQLSSATGVPARFAVAFARSTQDCRLAEMHAHSLLEFWRYSGREFFSVPILMAIMACEAAIKVAMNEGHSALYYRWFDATFVDPKVKAEIESGSA